jgi:two-component system, OmpR family, sensor kinase
MSLRARFVAASSAVALTVSSTAFCAVWIAYNATQERQLDAALAAEAEADAAEASYAEDALHGGAPVLRRGDLGPITKYGAIYDGSGQPLVWTSNLEPARPAWGRLAHALGAPFDLWWNNRHLRAMLVPIRGRDAQTLWLATPRTDLDGDSATLARKMAVAALVSTIVSAAVTSWVARLLTRDHERIAAAARAVAGGDLAARVGPTSSDAEMVQLGRDVDEMIARLAILVETQQRFIANASHELRSPITTLLGELSFALRSDRDASAYREAIGEALGSARRLKALTEDLLELARIGAAEVEPLGVRLAEVVDAAMDAVRPGAAQTGVALENACNGAVVDGQFGDLQRLVRNLLENAVRHASPGGRVRIEAHGERASVFLTVTDDGSGVPEDARERIFEPFFRLAAPRGGERGGTGLGLAIGRGIARAHGGDLWLDAAAPGTRGARFVVRFPASRSRA